MKIKTLCEKCGYNWQKVQVFKILSDGFIELFNGTIEELGKSELINKNVQYFDIEKDDDCTLIINI